MLRRWPGGRLYSDTLGDTGGKKELGKTAINTDSAIDFFSHIIYNHNQCRSRHKNIAKNVEVYGVFWLDGILTKTK